MLAHVVDCRAWAQVAVPERATGAQEALFVCHGTKELVPSSEWVQESVLQRCFVAEKLTAIAASPSGAFVAAGATSGNLYIWNTATGRLRLGFKAHYKVRCDLVLLHVLVLACPGLLCCALSLQVP